MKEAQKKVSCWVVVVFALVCFGAGSAWATPIIAHQGSNNPLTEGWWGESEYGYSGGTEVTASGSHDYWELISNTRFRTYTYSLDTFDISSYNWSVEASIRVIDSPGFSMHVFVSDGLNFWGFVLSGDQANSTGFSRTTSVDFSDYNTFQIQFSKNGVGIADDTADFFINGNLVFDDVDRTEALSSPGSPQVIRFSNGGHYLQGTGRYEYVHLDTEPFTNTVPEPTTMLLFGMGLLGFAGTLRRQATSVSV